MRFGDLSYSRVFAIQAGTQGAFVPAEFIDPHAVGELREGGTRWCGRDANYFAIVASVDAGVER